MIFPVRLQAVDFGLPKRQRYQTSGMVVRPGFYYSLQDTAATGEGGREAELIKLGLDPSVRTCLVCWGGLGSATVLDVGKCIAKSKIRCDFLPRLPHYPKTVLVHSEGDEYAKPLGDIRVLLVLHSIETLLSLMPQT